MVPNGSARLTELSDELDKDILSLRRDFQRMNVSLPEMCGDEALWATALTDKEFIDFSDRTLSTISLSYQRCIEVYKVVTKAIDEASAK